MSSYPTFACYDPFLDQIFVYVQYYWHGEWSYDGKTWTRFAYGPNFHKCIVLGEL